MGWDGESVEIVVLVAVRQGRVQSGGGGSSRKRKGVGGFDGEGW